MRDLEIRGAGNLLGDEQSGHVAAVGFELYCQMLEDAAEELRAGAEELPAEPREPVRIDVDVDAYVPADYIPFEAAKIDVHRRVAAAREPGELRALREELEDRFGPLPDSVANLLDLQRVRIALGDAGARNVEFRAGRLRVSPVELDSEQRRGSQRAGPGGDLSMARAHDRRPGPGGGGRAPRRAAGARRRARRGQPHRWRPPRA